MRQEHRAGEKLFVDYAGRTVAVVDRHTGELRQAQVFVAVLGASNYTFAEATWTQALPHWIASHVRAFEFLGGCSELVIPDNLGSAVSRAHRYEPDTNPTYHDLARHYGVAVLPARVRKHRDKAKAEVGVQIVQRWILAALRHRTFFSLSELNAAIAKLLERLNERAFRKLPGSRRSLFEQLDRPALRPLPTERYVFAQWKKVRVNIDYHVEFERHYYSVPHALVGRQLDARITANTVECLYRGQRVASHVRSEFKGRHTTADEHMPEKHRRMGRWTPERFTRWAEKIGPSTGALITTVLGSRRHPQQAFRSCLGILRLAKSYGDARLEAAARRALAIGTNSYGGAAGGSGPTLCWKGRLRIVEPRRWGWNPNGAGSTGSCAALSARIATRALSVPSRVRTAPTSATHRSSCSGSNPMTRSRAWWTSSTRRWTQRIAPASPTGSRRNALAAALRLGARSACATTASTSSSSPGSRAARQSGSRLKVVWLSGQYQRAIFVPRGVLRA